MNKNDRPTKIRGGYLTYYDINKIPHWLGSKAKWEERGFRVIKGCGNMGNVEHWNGTNYIRFQIYHRGQVEMISGEKAKARREGYYEETNLIGRRDSNNLPQEDIQQSAGAGV